MKPVSVWTVNLQNEINEAQVISDLTAGPYKLQCVYTNDSLWVVCEWPNAQRMAFRVAYAFGSTLSDFKTEQIESGLCVKFKSAVGEYQANVTIPESDLPMFHYTTSFKPSEPLLIPFFPRDIVPLNPKGSIAETVGTIHAHQVGTRTGLLFASFEKPQTGSLLYFQNLTSLNAYCEATQSSAAETVGGEWPEIGFQLPQTKEKPVPASKYCISDAYVVPGENPLSDENEIARNFLDELAAVYIELPKPVTVYRDWPEIAEKSLADISNNKGCWTYSQGHPYLNAYLCDYKTPPEIMVQLSVLYAVHEYAQWKGGTFPIIDELKGGLRLFYDKELKTIARWLPALRDELDESEEQKVPMIMDSWYLHHPLMNLSKFALDGDKEALELLLDAVDYAVRVAQQFNYEWPVFYNMKTLEIQKEETAPGKGGEKDVAGGYAYVMFNTYKLTGDKKYLEEAKRAAKSLKGKGFDVFYQANTTAFSAVVLLRLYNETKEREYLDLSFMCLAGIFKNLQLWQCNYGNGRYFPDFFGIFPLSDAPYKAAYEEMEVIMGLHDYINESEAVDLPPSITLLISEMIRYSVHRLPFYYPPMLPADIFSGEIKTGELDPKLWIPIEDLYDGWEKHGKVGQEVYGAGVGFGVAPRHYNRFVEDGFVLFCDYPVTQLKKSANRLSLRIIGAERFSCRIMLLPDASFALGFSVTETTASGTQEVAAVAPGHRLEYSVRGNSEIQIEWNKTR